MTPAGGRSTRRLSRSSRPDRSVPPASDPAAPNGTESACTPDCMAMTASEATSATPPDGELTTLSVGDITGEFFVAAYQRGYRWGEQEVQQLLDDLRESNGSTYFLQPVVVGPRVDGSWELVDGQQRLTTLYLIFRYLQREHLPNTGPNYSITYETRPGSKEYLDRLDEETAVTNIDYFHMFQAYQRITAWFDGFGPRAGYEATRLYQHLFDGAKVIWYEAPTGTAPNELFRRLNVGRIPLTDAELVKALLLSRSQQGSGRVDRAPEIATHWDAFERDLRSPEVWAFVTGEAKSQATHLSLLLDTLAGGPTGPERPLFHTFESLRNEIEADPEAFWERVVDLHSLVLGWYEDRDLFHKVGFLIAVGRTFAELVELGSGKGRTEFIAVLDQETRDRIALTGDDLADLTYAPRTADVLLLMNVETIRRMQDSSERYSFRAHAASTWSLEHIHAQQSESLNTAEQWRTWLEFHRVALGDLPGLDDDHREQLLTRIDHALSTHLNQDDFRALAQAVTAALSPDEETADEDLHSITNLALLDVRDNAALSNAVFEVKRRHVIDRDKRGSYIPVCTRNVFLKYYTESAGQQLHFWSAADRQAYLTAIRDQLDPYLRRPEGQA